LPRGVSSLLLHAPYVMMFCVTEAQSSEHKWEIFEPMKVFPPLSCSSSYFGHSNEKSNTSYKSV
jgi:hypothetical protein